MSKVMVKPIRWISGFVLLIFMGSNCKPSVSSGCFPMEPAGSGPASDQVYCKGYGKRGGSFLQGRVKIIHAIVPNRKPMELLWTNSYTAEDLLLWTTIFSVLSFVHKNSLRLKPGTQRYDIGVWKALSKSFKITKERKKKRNILCLILS